MLAPLPPLAVEPVVDRWTFGSMALLLILGYFCATHVFWAPVSPGVDQNGYLVGGKLFAATASTGFKPAGPFDFVGRMWVQADDGRVFPKYPLGLSVIFAAILKLGGTVHGARWVFLVNPVAMTLALGATFFLARLVAGSFAGVLAVLVMATSPVTLELTNTPNSHATAVCLVAWGIYLLLKWWQSDSLPLGIAAGLLIGAAVTIRYTEGLLVLPLTLVALFNLRRPRAWRACLRAAAPLLAWALPVGLMAIYNWRSFHHLTGYDPTNESTGFTWESFKVNWETMAHELNNGGLYFMLPVAIAGLVMAWRFNRRLAAMLLLWVVPNLAIYTAYYWAPDNATIGYLRFFLTIFPALAVSALWLSRWMIDVGRSAGATIAPVVAIGLLVAVGSGVDLHAAVTAMEAESVTIHTLQQYDAMIARLCPAGSTIFGPDQQLNSLQFAGDWRLFDLLQFNRATIQRYANVDPDQPNGLQPQRAKQLYDRLKNEDDAELIRTQNGLMNDAFAAKRRVFVIYPDAQESYVNRFLRRTYTTHVIGSWIVPPDPRRTARRGGLGGPGGGNGGGIGGGLIGAPPRLVPGGNNARLGRRGANPNEPAAWSVVEVKPR